VAELRLVASGRDADVYVDPDQLDAVVARRADRNLTARTHDGTDHDLSGRSGRPSVEATAPPVGGARCQ
jgi:hypothetical protein